MSDPDDDSELDDSETVPLEPDDPLELDEPESVVDEVIV